MLTLPRPVHRPDLRQVELIDAMPIPLLRRMMRYGVAIDREYAGDLSAQFTREMEDLRYKITDSIPPYALEQFAESNFLDEDGEGSDLLDWTVNPNSAQQVAELLYDIMGLDKGENLKMTPDGKRVSTGKKQLERIKRKSPLVNMLLEYREIAKLKGTYTDALPRVAVRHPMTKHCPACGMRHSSETWRVHTEFVTTRTDTGRLASRRPNLQNIPARTKRGGLIRAMFVATKGTRLLSNDYSQVELRLLAHCAQEQAMLDVFRRNGDLHLETTCRAFDRDVRRMYALADKADRIKKKVVGAEWGEGEEAEWVRFSLFERAPCKNVNFGVVYGLAAKGLLDLMALTYATAGIPMPEYIDLDWCERFIETWFDLHPAVRAYLRRQVYLARRYGFSFNIFGRVRLVPELRSALRHIQGNGERQAGNTPIQGAAAEVMKIAMGALFMLLEDAGLGADGSYPGCGSWVWPLLTIHDEVIFEADEEIAEDVGGMIGETMEGVGDGWCTVPLKSDGKTMERWKK